MKTMREIIEFIKTQNTRGDYKHELTTKIEQYTSEEDEKKEFHSFEEFYEWLEEWGVLNGEVIYYASAVDYIKENDASMRECFDLLREFGYLNDENERLNSEVLASMLQGRILQECISEIAGNMREYIEDHQEEEQEEEEKENQ